MKKLIKKILMIFIIVLKIIHKYKMDELNNFNGYSFHDYLTILNEL
jgi:hypothetical protein